MFEFKSFVIASGLILIGLSGFLACSTRQSRQWSVRHFVWILLATQAAAFMSPGIFTYNAIVFAVTFIACRERRLIAPTFIFLLVTVPIPSSVITLGGTYISSYDASTSVALGALCATLVKVKGNASRRAGWDLLAFAMFLLSAVPNMRDGTFTNALRAALEGAVAIIVPYYVVSRAVRSFDDVRDTFYGFVAACSGLATLAIYETFHTWPIYRLVIDRYGASGSLMMVKMRGSMLRAPGPFPESTTFGLCLAMGLIAAVACRRIFASTTKQLAICLLIAMGIMSTQSRGAWLGVLAGILVADIYDARFGALFKKLTIGGVCVGLLMAVGSALPGVKSLPGMGGDGGDTVEYRSKLLDRGLEEIRKHPIVGETPANIQIAMQDMRQGEGIIDFVNTYLYMGLTTGIPGFLLFVYIFLASLAALWMAKASVPPRHLAAFRRTSSAAAIFGGLTGMAVMISVTAMITRSTSITMMNIALTAALVANMRAARRPAGSGLSRPADPQGALARPTGSVPVAI